MRWFQAHFLLGFCLVSCVSSSSAKPLPPHVLGRFRAASKAINSDEFDKARELIQSLKSAAPTEALSDSILVLERRLFGRELTHRIQEASTLTVEPEVIPTGKSVSVTLHLKNPQDFLLRIPAPSKGFSLLGGGAKGKGFIGRFRVASVTYDAYGNLVRNQGVEAFEIEEQIDIPPQESWVQTSFILIPRQDGLAFRDYWILCEIRFSDVEVGEMTVPIDAIRIGPAKFRAFPEGYQKLEKNPLEGLIKALEKEGPEFDLHVFIAAVLMPEEERKKAVPPCIQALSSNSQTRRRSAMTALRWLTHELEPGFEKSRWLAWWEGHRKEYEESTSP